MGLHSNMTRKELNLQRNGYVVKLETEDWNRMWKYVQENGIKIPKDSHITFDKKVFRLWIKEV